MKVKFYLRLSANSDNVYTSIYYGDSLLLFILILTRKDGSHHLIRNAIILSQLAYLPFKKIENRYIFDCYYYILNRVKTVFLLKILFIISEKK